MQKTIYTCDSCDKEIGPKKHISLSFGQFSGVAVPPGQGFVTDRWSVVQKLQGKFLHFCNGQCIGRFFSKLIKDAGIKEFTGNVVK